MVVATCVCVLSLTGCEAMLASVLSMVVAMCVCVLSLIGCQAMLASVLLWLWPRVCCR